MKRVSTSVPADRLPLHSVGIIYSTSEVSAAGREIERYADCEVIEVAHAVQSALNQHGLQVELVDLDPDRIADLCKYDFVFNLAETIYGFPLADYEVAEKLEALNIQFTGSGSGSLKACLNKAFTKSELQKHAILTPAFELYFPGERVRTRLNFPVIVKPVHEDGSFGITSDSVCWNDLDLERQVANTHRLYLQAALVEEFIEGRDVSAAILGNGASAICLPLSEIIYHEENIDKFLTFDAKWSGESLSFRSSIGHCPCQLEPDVQAEIQRVALQAFRIMNCRDYARSDFRIRGKEVFILEVNSNPCLNPADTSYVRCGKAQGYDYNDLIYQILRCSFKNRLKARDPISIGTRYDHYTKNIIENRSFTTSAPAISYR
jgi:D-alanine-D-alanine ligase